MSRDSKQRASAGPGPGLAWAKRTQASPTSIHCCSNGPAAPRLAGLSYEYLAETMRRYADGERANNADMVNLMKAIPQAEREAMARYISSL